MDFIHYHETFIKCPYCNHEDFDMCDYGFEKYKDEEEKKFTCAFCGKDFVVMLHISYSFSTSYIKEQP